MKLAEPTPEHGLDARDEGGPRGIINCCMSFSQSVFQPDDPLMRGTIESLNGKSLFALGGEEGFWVGEPEKSNCQFRWHSCQDIF